MAQTYTDFTKGLVKDMYPYGLEAYDSEKVVWQQYMEEIKIDAAQWKETTVIPTDEPEETGSHEAYKSGRMIEGYTAYGKVIDLTKEVSFTKDTVRDLVKMKDILQKQSKAWGAGCGSAEERYYAKIFNRGGFTSGDPVFNGSVTGGESDPSGDGLYDGTAASVKPFFNLSNNTRTKKAGIGTYYNGVALALTPTNFESLWNRIVDTNAKNENEEGVSISPDVLIVPKALELTARRILESTLIPGSAQNDTNVLQSIVKLVVNPKLSDSDAWFIGCAKKGIKALKRMEPTFDFWEEKSERVFKAGVEYRVGVMIWNWTFWGGSNFSTS